MFFPLSSFKVLNIIPLQGLRRDDKDGLSDEVTSNIPKLQEIPTAALLSGVTAPQSSFQPLYVKLGKKGLKAG